MATGVNAELVEAGDLDELTRHAERLCAAGAWEDMLDLRQRCQTALERGKQLWPTVSLLDYLLALRGPAKIAASVLVPGTGQFALGPLYEVAASSHSWLEVSHHASRNPITSYFAHERAIRGDEVDVDHPAFDAAVLDIPLQCAWEPQYMLAEYKDDEANFPLPPHDALSPIALPPLSRSIPAEDAESIAALNEIVRTWTSESNGQVQVVAVEGGPTEAIGEVLRAHRDFQQRSYSVAANATLPFLTEEPTEEEVLLKGEVKQVGIAPLSFEQALVNLAWAGASGGAHGRRKGTAVGRFNAWWAVAALSGMIDDWPVPSTEIQEAGESLRWWIWRELTESAKTEESTGWRLQLAIHDPEDELAWAIRAVDSR